jgi:acyl-CoA dehydrogenase
VLAYFYAWARVLRIVDGPDAVDRRTVARMELKKTPPFTGESATVRTRF